MWRITNFIYRAFRTVGTHCHPQDLVVPLTTVGNKDEEIVIQSTEIIKTNQFSSQNVDKLQKISYQQV